MTQLKQLHKGKCLEDLQSYYKVPETKGYKLKTVIKSTQNVLEAAEKYYREGDEEMSYINYMKYFNLIDKIRNSPDYVAQKQQYNLLIGGNVKLGAAMSKLEELSKSLKKRYGEIADQERLEKLAQLEQNSNAVNNNSPDHYGSDGFDDYEETVLALSSISNDSLYGMMQDPNSSVLIMDCRPRTDYDNSKLNFAFCVNVPEEIILAGMSAGMIQQQLDKESQRIWSSRAIKDHVILMDWNTKGPEPVLHSPIWRLRDILQNFDIDAKYKTPIKVLKGGYEGFILLYPFTCTNPRVEAPQSSKSDDRFFETIEYPSINDITMKDEMVFVEPNQVESSTATFPPSVDRNTKAKALKTYDENKNKLELLEKRKEILEKAVKNGREHLETKKTLNNIINEVEDEEILSSKMTKELYYKLMQLESDERDYKLENERLRKQIEEYQRREAELGEIISEKEAENLEKVAKVVQVKAEERKKIDEELEKYPQQNEKQLEIVINREQKRHMKPPTDEDSISKPKIPQFDRSTKPLNKTEYFAEKIHRDFSPVPGPVCIFTLAEKSWGLWDCVKKESYEAINPKSILSIAQTFFNVGFECMLITVSLTLSYQIWKVLNNHLSSKSCVGRGLTGLKNLGNTCYMNSIMQCLSNTTELSSYFTTHAYRKHINRSNKTKGRIVEEVAALIEALWSGHYKCVASKDLRYIIGQYQQIFRGIEQQDSHEFLTIIMDWLHSDLQTIRIDSSPRDNLPQSEKAWMDFTKSSESFILRLFYGQIKSTVKCTQCGKESATYECFSNLSLELPSSSNRCQLRDCLKLYFDGERIRGWNCPNCKDNREAVKKLDISKLPPVLVVHFKRFYADPDSMGSTYKKKQSYINFPLVDLDMTPYIAPSEIRSSTRIPGPYYLYAVSNHYGSMEGGHYTAFCKNSQFEKWFKYDDQIVTQLDRTDVISSAAYILFYTYLPRSHFSES